MRRDLPAMAAETFDVVVVGGGIHGICAARDAALRGYTVALLERGDFGTATSHNSLKLVHGGLRYIQHLDFGRMRRSLLERRAWLKTAPHLVRPLQFTMQTFGHVTRGPEALWTACRVHDALGYDRNRGLTPERRMPPGRLLSRSEVDAILPGAANDAHNGGACWYDGQMLDPSRIMIECVESATDAGAAAANYAEVFGILTSRSGACGVRLRDRLTGDSFEIRSRSVVNAAGPWVDDVLRTVERETRDVASDRPHNLNMNIVTRPIVASSAIGVKSKRRSDSRVDAGGRLYFITPWRGVSVIGTTHVPYSGAPDDSAVSDEHIAEFVDEINAAHPPAELAPEDVLYCYWGLTPSEGELEAGEAKRSRHGEVVDHGRENGPAGLYSIVGVKWTTARWMAQVAIDRVEETLGVQKRPCTTDTALLPGARGYPGASALQQTARRELPVEVNDDDVNDLVIDYGVRWATIRDGADDHGALNGASLFAAKVRRSVDGEMAVRLADVLMRRTNLLQRGLLRRNHVAECARIMAETLGWSTSEAAKQMTEFEQQAAAMHTRIAA